MITFLTAHTLEVDDTEHAVTELLEQLDLAGRLRANAVGLLTCSVDFLHTGIIPALCGRLPFDVVGITTYGAATNEEMGLAVMTLCVLTSEDVHFSAVLTEPLSDEQEGPIRRAYEQAAAKLPEQPSLILTYAPMLKHVGGEKLVSLLDSIAGGKPLFGALACDHHFDFHEAQTVHNGKTYTDRMGLVLLSGPVTPRFFLISIPRANIQKQQAVITDAKGNLLKEVNGISVADYLRSTGLIQSASLEGSKAIPIIVDYQDGTAPVARAFYTITPEGHAVCGGGMPVNATFALATMDYGDVISSAEDILREIQETEGYSGLLIVSCRIRGFALDTSPLAEARKVHERIGQGRPYQFCYSVGEICPVYDENGNTANRFHNFSFTVCMI